MPTAVLSVYVGVTACDSPPAPVARAVQGVRGAPVHATLAGQLTVVVDGVVVAAQHVEQLFPRSGLARPRCLGPGRGGTKDTAQYNTGSRREGAAEEIAPRIERHPPFVCRGRFAPGFVRRLHRSWL